jgi:hypothetical protein
MRLRRAGISGVVAVACALAAGGHLAHATPRCFGAAARDPSHPCDNPRLQLVVRPTPDLAELTPNVGCVREQLTQVLDQCSFGVPAETAAETVAVIGDSHAAHWRAALAVVARRKNWRVLELARPHCPLSTAVPDSGEPTSSYCGIWTGEVTDWLAANPQVSTVYVSAAARAPIVVPPGHTDWAVRVHGFMNAWSRLPASVQRIIVIRDNPTDRTASHDCVRHAMAAHRPASRTCATARRVVLPPDAEVAAARRLPARGIRVVNLTHYFCGGRHCLPVVGGVLVHKDVDHLTQLFARTLGPFLLRATNVAAAP